MKRIQRLCLCLCLVVLLPTSALAWTPNEEQQAEINSLASVLTEANKEGQWKQVVDALPMKLYAEIAKQSGMTPEQVTQASIGALEAAMTQITLKSVVMEMDRAEYLATPSGMEYVIVPTRTQMKLQDVWIEAVEPTLMFVEDGGFRAMRIADAQQVILLRKAYPGFAGVTFDSGTKKIME